MHATVLGWREWLALPQLGIAAIRAKIDTGARSSALHVESLSTFHADGLEYVQFGLRTGADAHPIQCQAPVFDRRPVTDSGGHTTERVFIRTELALAGQRYAIEVNLTNRRNMLFPMLLGRTAMGRHFLVNPARSFVLGDLEPPSGPAA